MPHSFQTIDAALAQCRLTKEQRIVIYKILASILFLGEIEFEKSDIVEECKISASSVSPLANAAHLLGIEASKIEDILLNSYINVNASVNDSRIRFVGEYVLFSAF